MKTNLSNGVLLYTPDKKGQYPLVVIFGGMAYATPSWMAKQLSQEYFEKAILLIIPYTGSYKNALADANAKLKELGYKTKAISLMGFSAGAYDVQENFSKNLYFVGLIDPSLNAKYLSLLFNNKTFMLYNANNWGAYPSIKSLMPQFAETILNLGGNAISTKLSHENIPKDFFQRYKKDILSPPKSAIKKPFYIEVYLAIAGVAILATMYLKDKLYKTA